MLLIFITAKPPARRRLCLRQCVIKTPFCVYEKPSSTEEPPMPREEVLFSILLIFSIRYPTQSLLWYSLQYLPNIIWHLFVYYPNFICLYFDIIFNNKLLTILIVYNTEYKATFCKLIGSYICTRYIPENVQELGRLKGQ